MRALHILLNREAGRVQRGFTDISGARTADVAGEDTKLTPIRVDRLGRGEFAVVPGIYIADPIGNLVFRYELDVNPKDVQQDLKKLLKVSQIG